jgi:hypothetical protein
MNRRVRNLLVCLFLQPLWPAGWASDYAQRKVAVQQHCEAIDPGESQSGLAFNPDGYKSYYVQSECFQNAAIQFRDGALCDRVRRRYSLFWSSWGVSLGQCQKLVAQGVAADRAEIEGVRRSYLAAVPQLKSFRVERNGNGRDFDIVPEFTAGYAHGYMLTFEIAEVQQQPVLLHSDGCFIGGDSRLRIFVPQAEVRARFPGMELNHVYKVRATMTLSMGNGGLSGYWSDAFLESVFPARERTQSLTIESRF